MCANSTWAETFWCMCWLFFMLLLLLRKKNQEVLLETVFAYCCIGLQWCVLQPECICLWLCVIEFVCMCVFYTSTYTNDIQRILMCLHYIIKHTHKNALVCICVFCTYTHIKDTQTRTVYLYVFVCVLCAPKVLSYVLVRVRVSVRVWSCLQSLCSFWPRIHLSKSWIFFDWKKMLKFA